MVAKKDSPLIIGVGDKESFVASDVPAILDHTNSVIYLEEGDIGTIIGSGYNKCSRKYHKSTAKPGYLFKGWS